MPAKIKMIPNPNKMSLSEQSFIHNSSSSTSKIEKVNKNEVYKGRMISMSNSFFADLNKYLEENPTEGNRSSFIVRVIAEYIRSKKKSSYS